jgi:hypothetical protein
MPLHIFRGQYFPDKQQRPYDTTERTPFLVAISDACMPLMTMRELNQVRVMSHDNATLRSGVGELLAVLCPQ